MCNEEKTPLPHNTMLMAKLDAPTFLDEYCRIHDIVRSVQRTCIVHVTEDIWDLQGILVVHKANHMPQRELHEMETRERGCTPHTAASPNLPEALSPLVKSRKFQKRHLLAIMCSRVPRAPKRTTPMAHAHAEPVLFLCCGNTCLATSNIEQNIAGQRTHKQFRYSSSSHRARCCESTDVH